MNLKPEAGCPWSLLSDAERARGATFRRNDDTRAFCQSHAFLRRVLSGYLGIDPVEIAIGRSETGKPYLLHDTDLRFNLSHCSTAALLALAQGREIGVDVEDIHPFPDLEQVIAHMLTLDEQAALTHHEGERLVLYLRAWTRKEAILKALGKGLSLSPQSFSVPLEQGGCWMLSGLEPASRWGGSAMLRDVSRDQLIAALAGEDVCGPLIDRDFNPEDLGA
jgi:4'-phosphopantetheinyl transferase